MRILLFAPLILLTACARPEVAAFRSHPSPAVVAYQVPSSIPGAPALEKEYAAALRARLATRITVVPEGAPAPAHPVTITVSVTDLESRNRATPGQVGVATGVAVGAISMVAGNRNAIFDGFFWGLWAGTHAAAHQRRETRSLGYQPRYVNATILVTQEGLQGPLCEMSVDAAEVVDAMDPLRGSERDDEVRIREEEARAMARVVVWKLQDRFGWTAKPTPSFYRSEEPAPPATAPDPAPAAAPAPAAEPAPAVPAPADPTPAPKG